MAKSLGIFNRRARFVHAAIVTREIYMKRRLEYLLRSAAVVIALLFVLGGCKYKEPTYPVTGKVVFKDNGAPACTGVSVVFESTQAPYTRSMGAIGPDGTFVLSTDRPDNGAMQGAHRVSILPFAADGSGANLTPKISKEINPKYFEFGTSGLVYTIQPKGKNEFVIELERASRK